jgi:hypothetical protein
VTAALQQYADRGVFRGFRASSEGRGRIGYQFLWLTRRPMHASVDRRGVLAFPAVLPQAPQVIVAQLKSMVAERSTKSVPDHKRLDGRRAKFACTVRKGDFSLSVAIRGGNHEYAVSKALNLVNEMFVALHEGHPEYPVQHFGISQE